MLDFARMTLGSSALLYRQNHLNRRFPRTVLLLADVLFQEVIRDHALRVNVRLLSSSAEEVKGYPGMS